MNNRQTRLDFLRGIAILGMLVANIPWHVGNSMSRVIEPDFTSITAWLLQYLIFDSRFMPIFCFLFGAGFYMLRERASNQQIFQTHYLKRMLSLFLLGVAHAYLLWPGDILITYAVCGCILLLFQKASVKVLLTWGVAFKLVDLIFGQWPQVYQYTFDALLFAWWFDVGPAPMSAAAAYSGSYLDLLNYNIWRNQFLQWTALPYFRVWNALGLMLIGIALYRLGILQGTRERPFYLRLFCLSIALSLPLLLYGVAARIGINPTLGPVFGFKETLPLYNLTFRLGCTINALTILAAVHLSWHKLYAVVTDLMQQVGKMALSNYLFQS